MIIELQRAHTPEDYGHEEACGICGDLFRVEHVEAQISTDAGEIMGRACPTCVALMGFYKPEKFPTIEEYEAALSRFSGPIWESIEAASAAWRQGAPHREAVAAGKIERA